MRPDRPRAGGRPPIVTIAAGIGLPVRASTTAPWIAAGDVTNERAAAAALVGVPGAGVEAAEAIDAPAVGTSAVACAANAAPDGAKQTMASAHALALDHWANGFVIDLSPWAGRRTHSRASRRQPSNARPPRGERPSALGYGSLHAQRRSRSRAGRPGNHASTAGMHLSSHRRLGGTRCARGMRGRPSIALIAIAPRVWACESMSESISKSMSKSMPESGRTSTRSPSVHASTTGMHLSSCRRLGGTPRARRVRGRPSIVLIAIAPRVNRRVNRRANRHARRRVRRASAPARPACNCRRSASAAARAARRRDEPCARRA